MSGEQLKEQRAAVGLTQAGLAAELGVTRGSVARWEGGVHKIDARTARAINDVLRTVRASDAVQTARAARRKVKH